MRTRRLVTVDVVCNPITDVAIVSDPITGIDLKTEIVPGAKGTTFIPSVSSDGIISWTNDGGLDNPDPVDITGPQGNPTTVNGYSGESITLTYADVGALSADTYIPVYEAGEGIAIESGVISATFEMSVIDCGTSSEVVD